MVKTQTDIGENPPVSWGGRDGRREPDSGLGYTQDCHSQRRTADRDCETEGRPTRDRIPEITGIRRNSQWDFPQRRTLFTSDGTYSISSDNCCTECEFTRRLTPVPAVNRRQPRQAIFTSTPVPRYSGKSNWEQYLEIFEAIVCSNGWDNVTG